MIRILIIEDEEPAAERLEKLLLDLDPEIEIIGKIDSVSAAVEWFRTNSHPDLLMLDIQLSDRVSFDIFKEVDVDASVIFTTAYDEYAIRAFDLNSIDYLLKPISSEKLKKSLDKFKKLHSGSRDINVEALLSAMKQGKDAYKQRFMISMGSRIRSIEAGHIGYFYSLDKSTFLCSDEGRNYPVDYSLDKLEELLDPDQFFRINRRFIVSYRSIEQVQVLSKSRIEVITKPPPEETLLVSAARSHAFRLWLDR